MKLLLIEVALMCMSLAIIITKAEDTRLWCSDAQRINCQVQRKNSGACYQDEDDLSWKSCWEVCTERYYEVVRKDKCKHYCPRYYGKCGLPSIESVTRRILPAVPIPPGKSCPNQVNCSATSHGNPVFRKWCYVKDGRRLSCHTLCSKNSNLHKCESYCPEYDQHQCSIPTTTGRNGSAGAHNNTLLIAIFLLWTKLIS